MDAVSYTHLDVYKRQAQGGVKGIFRCSYLPPATTLRPQTGVDEWVEEVIQKLGLQKGTSV